MNTDELAIYEQMTVMTPSDELEDAVENLLAEVKRLREQLDNARHWVSLYEDEDMMSNFKMWIGEEE